MDPGEVPEELSDLSLVEEQLIARVHPVVCVYRLRGGQLAYKGQVINFPQEVREVARVLPRPIDSLSNMIVFRRSSGHNHADFSVNRNRVRRALQWLKTRNCYYRDVEISEEALESIPLNDNILERLSTNISSDENDALNDEETDTIVTTDAVSLLPRNHETAVREAVGVQDPQPWPTLSSMPINEFTHVGYIAMAFPCLFPTGAGDLRAARIHTVTPLEYFRHLMYYKDQRFSKNARFRFFAMNSTMRWEALKKGNVCVRRNSELHNCSAEQLRHMLQQNPTLASKLMCFNSSMRGSSSYWFLRSRELLDMVTFLGPPTIFFTLSAADFHWPEIYRLLSPETDWSTLSENESIRLRVDLLNQNPSVVCFFFKERADFFIQKVIVPHFQVKDFWFRTEFQHRGSPHIHGILWLDGAPDVKDLDNKSQEQRNAIAQYFGTIVSTVNPRLNSPKPPVNPCRLHYSQVEDHETDYVNLLNACQRHTRHGPQCLRKKRGTGEEVCRFHFPFELQETTCLINEEGKWSLKTERNDPLLNRHNRYIIEHWRANIDVQPILSLEAVLQYIAKYASKAEPRSRTMEALFADVLSSDRDEVQTAKTAVQRLFVKMCSERDYSAQETFQILLGWPLYHSSREFVHLNVEVDDWISVDNQEGRPNKLIDVYPQRPEEYTDLSMVDFFSQFYKKGSRFVKRRKAAVVRILPRFILRGTTEDERFYRQQTIVRVPWRDLGELQRQGETWKDVYDSHVQILQTEDVLNLPELDEEFETDSEEQQLRDDWMLLAGMGPNSVRIILGFRPQDINYDWNSSYSNYESPLSLSSYLSMKKSEAQPIQSNIISMPAVSLSNEQSGVLHIVQQQLNSLTDETVNPCRTVVVQGRAGSGKSTLIQAMTATIYEKLGDNSFLLLAPTGAAALNINGSTIHSALHIGTQREMTTLTNEALQCFQNELRDCRFIIIDEMSMLGCSLLKKVDIRCREAKPDHADEPFGGMFAILLGDLKQLPPVMDRPLYGDTYRGNMYDQGQVLFRNMERCVVLQCCHRQQGESQQQFRDVLDRISNGEMTVEDWRFLMTRQKTCVPPNEVLQFQDSLRLFTTNAAVHEYNIMKLGELEAPVALLPAKHSGPEAARADQEAAQGLEATLHLAVGARVMLKQNIWVSKGLVNGALGTVKDILYTPGTKPPNNPPLVVFVAFDAYTGPTINGMVPIPPITKSWKSSGRSLSRTQFPLTLAWAVTIHKSQGLTLQKAVVSIGEREIALGITYVALSRVRTISDLLLDPPFSFDRLQKIRASKLLALRKREEQRFLGQL